MHPLTLECGATRTTIHTDRPDPIGPIDVRTPGEGWVPLSRGGGLRISTKEDTLVSPQWRTADRSPSSVRLVSTSRPIGVIFRAEALPGRVDQSVEVVNTSGRKIRVNAGIGWSILRTLTVHAEDPEVEIDGSHAMLSWAPSGVKLTLSTGQTPLIVTSNHAEKNTPWFTLAARHDDANLEPGESLTLDTSIGVSVEDG